MNTIAKQTSSAKILIMDDEELICKLLNRMISRIGYKSDTALDGVEAIRKYSSAIEKKEPFDLIIMDLTIPAGMGGKEAVQKILEIDKNAKVIVSSGYSTCSDLAEYKSFGFVDMIEKPYTIDKLEEVIQRVLFD